MRNINDRSIINDKNGQTKQPIHFLDRLKFLINQDKDDRLDLTYF